MQDTFIIRRFIKQRVIGYQREAGGRIGGTVIEAEVETDQGVKTLYRVSQSDGITRPWGTIRPRVDIPQLQNSLR